MAVQTLTFNSSALFTKLYSTTELKESANAKQGFYKGYPSPAVGIMRFDGLADINWKVRSIRSIEIVLHHAAGGYYGRDKTFGLYGSNLQKDSDTTTYGSEWIDGQKLLGQFSIYCPRDSDVTLSLPANGIDLLANIKDYLKTGSDTFCLYMNESNIGSGSYTANYLSISAASITIVFDVISTGIYYPINGRWTQCIASWGINGKWVDCVMFKGLNNKWVRIGESELTYVTYPSAAMTSDSSQGCVASASSKYSSSYPVYYAFDNERSKSWASTTADETPWIQLQMPQALKNISVKVYTGDTTNKYKGDPVSGTLMGSNDGASWTQIGAYSGWSEGSGGYLGEIVCSNTIAYSYVRLNIASYESGKSYAMIGYMTVTGAIPVE